MILEMPIATWDHFMAHLNEHLRPGYKTRERLRRRRYKTGGMKQQAAVKRLAIESKRRRR